MCKVQLQKQLQDIFSQMSTTSITIEFDDHPSKSITVKACALAELTGKIETVIEEELHYHLFIRRRTRRSRRTSWDETENGQKL